MNYITVKEVVIAWDISERRVQVLCEQNRISEAQRLRKSWAISKDAKTRWTLEKSKKERIRLCISS